MKFIEDIFNLLQNEDIISVTVQDDDFEEISLAGTIKMNWISMLLPRLQPEDDDHDSRPSQFRLHRVGNFFLLHLHSTHPLSASSSSSSSVLCLPTSKQSSDSSPPEKIIRRRDTVPSIVVNNSRYYVPNNSSFFNSTEILKQTQSSTSESRSFESSTSPSDPTAHIKIESS